MRLVSWAVALLIVPTLALAQDTKGYTFVASYTVFHADNGDDPASNLHGGLLGVERAIAKAGAIAYRVGGDVGFNAGTFDTPGGVHVNQRIVVVTGGAVVIIHGQSSAHAFVRGHVGYARDDQHGTYTGVELGSFHSNGVASVAGGGVVHRVNPTTSIRIGVDLVMRRFSGAFGKSLRVAGGLTFGGGR